MDYDFLQPLKEGDISQQILGLALEHYDSKHGTIRKAPIEGLEKKSKDNPTLKEGNSKLIERLKDISPMLFMENTLFYFDKL